MSTDKVLEDLEDVSEEDLDDLPRQNSVFVKIMFFIMVGLMIFLMMSYVWITYPNFGIIQGWIASEPLQDDVLRTGDITVFFQGDTETEVVNTYRRNRDVETALCLEGNVSDNTYFVRNVYQPSITSQGFSHVTHSGCSSDTVLLFHTHPYQRCEASQQDIATLRRNQERDEDVAMIIMCSEERFSVYN